MGNLWSKVTTLFDSLLGSKDRRILILGLDNAGKTTLLYKLNLGESISTIPTIGFNCEKIRYKNIELTCWDIGGQKKIRQLWHHYFEGADAVIFVVDSSDRRRISEAKTELLELCSHRHLRDAVILIYANKQDLPKAMSTSEVAIGLDLKNRLKGRQWYVQDCIATDGRGLYEGLEYLCEALNKK